MSKSFTEGGQWYFLDLDPRIHITMDLIKLNERRRFIQADVSLYELLDFSAISSASRILFSWLLRLNKRRRGIQTWKWYDHNYKRLCVVKDVIALFVIFVERKQVANKVSGRLKYQKTKTVVWPRELKKVLSFLVLPLILSWGLQVWRRTFYFGFFSWPILNVSVVMFIIVKGMRKP